MRQPSSIVGYTSRSIEPGTWVLTAIQFEGVGGSGDVMMSDLVKGDFTSISFEKGDWEHEAPHIMVPVGDGYVDYWYVNYEEADFWFDGSDPDAGTPLAAGTGIWFCHHGATACNVSFAGQVISDSSVPVVAGNGAWKIVSNPFPKAFAISTDATYEGAVAISFEKGDWEHDAPHIMLPVGDGYVDYWYVNYEEADFWFDGSDPDEGATSPIGSAFWFTAPTEVTIRFAR